MAAIKKRQPSVLELKKEANALNKKLKAKQKELRKAEKYKDKDFLVKNRNIIDDRIRNITDAANKIKTLMAFSSDMIETHYETTDDSILNTYLDDDIISRNLSLHEENFCEIVLRDVEEVIMSISEMEERIDSGELEYWLKQTKSWYDNAKLLKLELPNLVKKINKDANFLHKLLDDTHG